MHTFQNVFNFSNWVRLGVYGSGNCDCFVLHFLDNTEITVVNLAGGGGGGGGNN